MNMKRIVFVAVGILIMLVIMGWMLHSMAHIDEINQRRREKDAGEALASQIITTAATTSIWDSLRQTESENESGQQNPENPDMPAENPEETAGFQEEYAPDEAVPATVLSNQTVTEVQSGIVVQ